MEENEEEGVRVFSAVASDRTRGNGPELKHSKFLLNTRKHFRTEGVVEQWSQFATEAVESPSLKAFKARLDTVLGSWL